MKKLAILLFIVFSTVFAYTAPVDPYAHSIIFDNIDNSFFKKALTGEGNTYTICIEGTSIGQEVISEETANQIFIDSINNWVEKTRHYILEYKDSKKFEDILQMIDNIKNLKKVPCNAIDEDFSDLNADLNIIFKNDISKNSHDSHVPAFITHSSPPYIYISTKRDKEVKRYIKHMTHELGHAFGLADQYSGQRYKGSFLYNSKVTRPSIMEHSEEITCDDIDGFITSIDRFLGKNREEFESFCSDGIFIKDGKSVIKPGQIFTFTENYEYFDAEIKIFYNTDSDNYYIMDMTLVNFIPLEKTLELVQNMGFYSSSVDTLNNMQIKIHGKVFENTSETNYDQGKTTFRRDIFPTVPHFNKPRTPEGLWTLVMYEADNEKITPLQEININYDESPNTFILTYLDTHNTLTFVNRKHIIPLLDYFPQQGSKNKHTPPSIFLDIEKLRSINILQDLINK